MTTACPLLRAPPFPGIPVAVAAVTDDTASPVTPDPERAEAVLAGIAAARVGGTFWAAPVARPAATIVRPRRGDDRAALRRECPAAALWVTGEADPWSVLAAGRRLVAHGDDDWVAVAVLTGAAIHLLSPGRFAQEGDDAAARRARVAAHLLEQRYRDPFTGEACSIERVVAILALWRDGLAANHGIVAAAGMAWWKRAAIRRFLWTPRTRPLRFRSARRAIAEAAAAGGSVAVWPSRIPDAAVAEAARRGVPLVRVEDGFIRSIGLGANLVPPLSVTVDRLGIHYDPSAPSELERLIEGGDFTPALLARAATLRTRIVADGISKYGGAAATALPPRTGRRLVLVPGQVEDDRSVLLGGGAVAGNLDLLRRVRAAEPEAEIWFRPHPDVDAGHRRGGVGDAEALRHVDRVVRGGGMAALLAAVDAVHVLTSLTGFEALLRGVPVTCHGMPFFAGWGLTRDLAPVPDRRTRRATLDELVAATLILYPRYLDPRTLLPCFPEILVARLTEPAKFRTSPLVRLRQLQGRILRRF